MSQLRFGIHYSCQSPEHDWEQLYKQTLKQAQLAETLGYESLYVAEHHFLPDGWIPTPMVFLGALAGVTDNMALGTDIIILPLHNPVEVAEQTAVLDVLSSGKAKLGVGIGWRDEEFDAYGFDKSERVERVEEGIELIQNLLTEDDVTYNGDVFSVEDLTVMPRPVQSSVPIWYGGQSKAAIDRAARMADAWIMSPIETRTELSKKTKFYHERLAECGREPADVRQPLRREAYVAEDDETAWEEVGEALLYEYQDVYGDYDEIGHSFDPTDPGEAIAELQDHAEDRFIIGGPETAIEELKRYQKATGMDEVLLRMHFPGLDFSLAEKSVRTVAEKVMPHFT